MPTGISETDVHRAADALVAQGERPTIERIRAHLGTGSPNTVTRWLKTWWQRLDERLRAGAPGLAAGNPPADVAALAQQWWEVAVTHAHAVASQALADAHAALQTRTDALTTSETQIAGERLAWAAERTELIHARDLAQRGVKDLEAHLQALGRHLDELQRQHAQVDTEREALLGQLLAAQAAAQDATAAANAARTEREQAHRAAEDRWLQEVDRARQEAARHAVIIVQRDKAIERMTIAQAELQERLGAADSKAAAAESRAETLQLLATQLSKGSKSRPPPKLVRAEQAHAKRKR